MIPGRLAIAGALATATACSLLHPGSDYDDGTAAPAGDASSADAPPVDDPGDAGGGRGRDGALGPVVCPLTDAQAQLCEDFDKLPPLAGWEARFFAQDGGVQIEARDAASPPRHLRVRLVEKPPGAVGQNGAQLSTFFQSPARRIRLELDYRLDDFAFPAGATEASGSAFGVQSLVAGAANVNVQVEVSMSSTEIGTARFRLRVYRGSTLAGGQTFADDQVVLGAWKRLAFVVELAPPDRIFVSVTSGGVALVPRAEMPVTIGEGDTWQARLGGFSGANPTNVRPGMTHDFDDVAVTLE